MDARNISLKNFMYQGGDDCISIKPRSFNISISNITCEGGNGVAIGSLGQYLEDNTVEDVTITGAKVCGNPPSRTQNGIHGRYPLTFTPWKYR